MENYNSDTLVERWEVVIAVGEHGGGGGEEGGGRKRMYNIRKISADADN